MPNPRSAGACSRGDEAQESTDRATVLWPERRPSRERTLEESKAPKRACWPPCPASPADPRRDAAHDALARLLGERLATPGNPCPGLAVRRAFGPAGQEVGATGERGRETLGPSRAVGRSTRTRTGAQARESGHGSSRRESSEGRLQGRERHERRPRSVGAPRRTACSARGSCVPRARPEPSRGAGTLRTAPVEAWRPPPSLLRAKVRGRVTRGTRRRGARGSKNPRRGVTRARPGVATARAASARRSTGSRDAVRL